MWSKTMPYTLRANAAERCPIDEFQTASEALRLALKTGIGRREALKRYLGAEKAKRESGWALELHL